MFIDIDKVKSFIRKLKSMNSRGQDEYPFWYLFQDEFKELDLLVKYYEEDLTKDY